jgi:hypothetical protein
MSDIVSGATREHLADASMADSRLPLAIVVTQLGVRGRVHRILTRDDTVPMSRAVLASCYIPGPYSRMYTIDRRPCSTAPGSSACRSGPRRRSARDA